MLKSVEISGFKSFAKKTELHFKSRVTAIVGPNGSGKSNVAEAFRFALGEQSMKSMRGKRGEDMIWNGTNEVPRSNRAQVKLTFENLNNIFDVDFEDVLIERVVHRDGGNEYFLNGSQVRLKDIYEFLSKAHIGASGHHIISQGEADHLLRANNKERREMIEDALGLKIYQYKREESKRKLLKTEENIKQVESLRREIAPHIKFLKKQMEKVERANELREKLSIFYKEYLKRESVYLKNQKNILEKELNPLKESLEDLDKRMDNAKKTLMASKNKDEKSKELLDIEQKIKGLRENRERLERELGKMEGEIYSNNKAIERTKSMIHSEDDKVVKLKDVESLAQEIFLDTEKIKQENILEKILQIVNDISKRMGQFIATYKEAVDTSLLDELVSRNTNLEKEKVDYERKINEIVDLLKNSENTYNNIKKSIEEDNESSRDAEREIFSIGADQNELLTKKRIIEERLQRLSLEETNWKREIQEGGVLLGQTIVGFENIEMNEGLILEENRDKQEERRRELEKMKIRLEELGGAGGVEISKEYEETLERDQFLEKELSDLEQSAKSLEQLSQELGERLESDFKEGVEKINKSFQEFFALMFGGGEAKLQIEKIKTKTRQRDEIGLGSRDDEEIFEENINSEEKNEEGLEISVSLPRKRIRGLEMLSGGERALTSIALLFAVSQVNPPPFIILDETDAALDEANSKKYGDMIESLSKYSQLILITHNRETMSRAGVIYGVTMGKDGVSRLLSIAFDEAVAVAK